MPHGHLSGARRASCMPGGYSLQANFAERTLCEVRRIPIARTRVNKGKRKGGAPTNAPPLPTLSSP